MNEYPYNSAKMNKSITFYRHRHNQKTSRKNIKTYYVIIIRKEARNLFNIPSRMVIDWIVILLTFVIQLLKIKSETKQEVF